MKVVKSLTKSECGGINTIIIMHVAESNDGDLMLTSEDHNESAVSKKIHACKKKKHQFKLVNMFNHNLVDS